MKKNTIKISKLDIYWENQAKILIPSSFFLSLFINGQLQESYYSQLQDIKFQNFNYQRNNQYINKSECKKQLTYGEDDDNPYSDNNYNYQIQEAQFQQKNPEMPLEIIHRNNEKKFNHIIIVSNNYYYIK